MPNITAQDERELAQSLYEMGKRLNDFRFGRWNEITPADRYRLEKAAQRLFDLSSDITADAIKISLHDLDASLRGLKQGTQKLKDALNQLDKVRALLTFAAAGIQLGLALSAGNPVTIASAVDNIANLEQE